MQPSNTSHLPDGSVVLRPKEKRRRRGLPKVSTGCITCKKRHVKCDEVKPLCLRCQRLGFVCDGYELKPTKTKPAAVRRDLLPKPGQATTRSYPVILPAVRREVPPKEADTKHARDSASSFFSVPAAISSSPPTNPEELQYFQYFKQESVNELSGGWNEPLWQTYLLQACHEAPFIYNMALTLAAQGRSERLRRSTYIPDTSHHHEVYSLKQYQSSLRDIRKYLASENQPDVRMFLLASLLIFIFEFKQGNIDTAVKQVRSTLALFKNMRSIKAPVIVYDHDIRCPETLEEVIIDMIARLDKQGFLIQAKQTSNSNNKVAVKTVLGMIHRSPDSIAVPNDFPNVFTARRYISFLQYWGRPNFANDAIKHALREIDRLRGKEVDGSDLGRLVPAQEFFDRFVETKQWHVAMDKLLERLQPHRNSEYRCALSVKIQGLATLLVMACEVGFRIETSTNLALEEVLIKYGSVRGLCEEMLHLSGLVVHDPEFLRCYVFDFGIIMCIFIILFATVDRDLEDQTVGILKAMRPRKEGVWDSCVMAGVAEMIVHSRSLATVV
ncbi:hypothetical protein ONS95_001423 [Cadophora gregata]|uniref:uncharacterized protein n=1 Tax=Cadophora gregata TaxID=51156 RepID=UPI0026DBF7B1|nr:uncharacterized protein ONS95_001423 [Cadophora gregata]KAK0111043.1 hypothetical protein ONS95_001423 [Cadophora gregata]